ncbi:MAG: efflux RND transporter periplasmic adaptor subunit, partial [Verrucomicrobiaceae bacterium]
MSLSFSKVVFLCLIMAAGAGGWFLGRSSHSAARENGSSAVPKVLLYQSPMHPWIKSDRPGNCTICGMKLVAVHEGEQGFKGESNAVVRLSSSIVNVLNVETVPVTRQPLHRTLRVSGTIDDDDTRHRRLSAYVDGRVERLGVRYIGAEVKEGELLATIYSPALLAARDEFILLARQPGSPTRESLLRAARERLVRLGLSQEQITKLPNQESPPNHLEILAPMSGTVVSRNVYEGQYVKEGDVLFEIADFSKMWFVFNAYERDLSWIAPGQMVEITSPAVPGESYTAAIDFIDPNLDPVTRSAKGRVILENPLVGEGSAARRQLLHKVYGDGVIHVKTAPVLAVPRSAVLAPGVDAIAYVAEGEGGYSPRKLKLGRAGDNVWEVFAGLQEGEKVVTNGNLLIDAQAQLDHGSGTGGPEHDHAPAADHSHHAGRIGEDLTDAKRKAAAELFTAADGVAAVMAADDLGGFNAKVSSLHAPAAAVAAAFGKDADWVTSTAQLSKASDLASARKDFYPFSKALAEFAHALRQRDPSFANVRIFECPMVKDAVPNAPERKGRWVQTREAIQNPFFGSEMLECGVEVK